MFEFSEKFCPVCKNKINRTATVCTHCGAALDENLTDLIPTTGSSEENKKTPTKVPESIIDDKLIPENGIAVYAAGTSKPFYMIVKKELVIGRKVEETSETFLDFSDMDGFNLGLSRRHVLIRRGDTGFEVIDLASTNGTWLNDERLKPNRPYRLASGSQLRVGRLRLLILYRTSFKNQNKTDI